MINLMVMVQYLKINGHFHMELINMENYKDLEDYIKHK